MHRKARASALRGERHFAADRPTGAGAAAGNVFQAQRLGGLDRIVADRNTVLPLHLLGRAVPDLRRAAL